MTGATETARIPFRRPPGVTPQAVLAGARRDPVLAAALVIFTIMVILAIGGPWIGEHLVGYDPRAPDARAQFEAPSTSHLFGTDEKGSDVFSRTISAPRTDLVIGLTATLIGLFIGAFLGLLAGYGPGRGRVASTLAELLTRLMDILQAFPVFIVALAMVAVIGTGTDKVIYVLSFLFSPIFFRYVRAETLLVRELTFVEAERAVGNSTRRIMFAHILPNSLTTATVQASPTMGYAILLTSGLTFVGAGVTPPTPEWGAMIKNGAELMQIGTWWPSVFPGIFLGLTVFSLAVIGEAIRLHWRGSGLRGY